MSGQLQIVLWALACVLAAAGAGCAAYLWGLRKSQARRRAAALAAQGANSRAGAQAPDAQALVMRYAESLTMNLFTGAAEPLTPSVRAKRAGKTRAGARYLERATAAGCKKRISVAAYCEARTRLAVAGMLLGALIGVLLSTELAVLLGLAGAIAGASLVPRGVSALKRERGLCADRHLSEMLEVVSLGLRSGLTFDRSFALYGAYFDNEFAKACAAAYRKWSLGLADRDEALHELAASFDCPQLSRIVDAIIRGLRFGTPITSSLEDAAEQARLAYRTALEERVAKAPVKMMLPTGALILPAMLLLVMGPILLELAGGF